MCRRRSPAQFVLRSEDSLVGSENPSTLDDSRKRGIRAAILDRYGMLVITFDRCIDFSEKNQ